MALSLHSSFEMRVKSFHREGLWLKPMTLELSLTPGLPDLQILGLPDAGLKESTSRIKAAIRAQGFRWPRARRVIVQLPPGDSRKHSQGLDLAIAAALLWETEQIPRSETECRFYGRLSLQGGVECPPDFVDLPMETLDVPVVTGSTGPIWPAEVWTVDQLKALANPTKMPRTEVPARFVRPPLPELRVGSSVARLLSIVAAGEHPFLIAGPKGSGKTTAARLVHPLLADPDPKSFLVSERVNRYFGMPLSWRPLVNPHHSATNIAIIGGADPIQPGEISRAHGGLLLLDEFLEFDAHIQESLREPIEMGVIHLARCGDRAELPARFLLIATTNLCPCGSYVPAKDHECNCPEKRRRPYLDRISGPMLDRFDGLVYSNEWRGDEMNISCESIFKQAERARRFAMEMRGQSAANHFLNAGVLKRELGKFDVELFPREMSSIRRENACLRLARTIADLNESERIRPSHLDEALNFGWRPHQRLRCEY
jgi:magnesium chelatase family protein